MIMMDCYQQLWLPALEMFQRLINVSLLVAEAVKVETQ